MHSLKAKYIIKIYDNPCMQCHMSSLVSVHPYLITAWLQHYC